MIQIQNLHFAYKKNKPLFRDLQLQLETGKIYGLLGKNGTGKSTLLKLIMGGLFPDQGTLQIGGYSAASRNPEMLQDVFLLQEESEMPMIAIKGFLDAYAPFYPRFDRNRFRELLTVFEVQDAITLSDLSFGQRKKVLISFAMATNVKYLIMDEPTNGLDIPSKSQFRKALLKGFSENQTIIISTHQIRDLNQLIESMIILENGRIVLNHDVSVLEEKLLFTRHLSEQDLPDLIYSEGITGSYVHIQPNDSGKPSEVELEVLFNAVIQNETGITQQL